MISKDKITESKPVSASRHGLTRWGPGHHLGVELCEAAKLALPIVLTQLGQIVMMTTDLVFIGRVGAEAVAAAALAGKVYVVAVTFGMGLVAAIAPIAAQAFGADNLGVVRRSLRMGLWAALLLSPPIVAFPLRGQQMLLALGQAPTRRGSLSNICSDWPGAWHRRWAFSPSVISWARSTGRSRSCGSRSRPSP